MMSMICEDVEVNTPSPDSPPGMTASKSSKSSSFQSLHSDDDSILADVSHFEDIGLDDDEPVHLHDPLPKSAPKPFSPNYPSDLRASFAKHAAQKGSSNPPRDLAARPRPARDLASVPKTRPPLTVQTETQTLGSRNTAHVPKPQSSPISLHFAASRSTNSLIPSQRRRSASPNVVRNLIDPPTHLLKPRRSSWQSARDRKSTIDLEKECDDDDGDIPDDLILDNVPISPRPPHERSKQPPSPRSEPRPSKDRVRSVGNGTPPVAVARGSLRSPTWKPDTQIEMVKSLPSSPLKARSKSWNIALSELSAETKALTEKLEEHANEIDRQYKETGSSTSRRRSLELPNYVKPRVKSAMAELPPLQRGNIMIDPLPISKEKEAVLSRTRPSWLPPKDPVEEKRHLREYQKMMAHSLEVEKRREAAKRARSACRDTAADSLTHIWEKEIIPRWDQAVRERRTRELWWKGVVPRCRGAVWSKAIGNDLGLTETSYDAALKRANEADSRARSGKGSAEDMRRSEWFRCIRRDVEQKTFVDLKIFQAGGPLHQSLIDVLSAYAMYRSDIGYITGCNTIAAILMLNLATPTASFIALANVLNRPLPLSFYASDPGAKASAYNLLLQTLAQKSPRLYGHINKLSSGNDNDPDVYLGSAFNGLFTTHLVLDEAARLWDIYVFEGDAVLVRAGVALLLRKEMELLAASNLIEVKEILAKTSKGRAQIVGSESYEDSWIKTLREAGKA